MRGVLGARGGGSLAECTRGVLGAWDGGSLAATRQQAQLAMAAVPREAAPQWAAVAGSVESVRAVAMWDALWTLQGAHHEREQAAGGLHEARASAVSTCDLNAVQIGVACLAGAP
eukprot:CAMPEP_0115869822 /NCGR_PEP_ID=MMETSP0287-20121206/22006_1 /TAXON_ID=412157 /ORGANISM="Chrysochromulina rotalis, Strain UIO044" /LENGTH=114 /DNA_ID=CAMNT_0003324519 /DNA_START=611 /DNA_END=951 /DNA_ORIENTATION=+